MRRRPSRLRVGAILQTPARPLISICWGVSLLFFFLGRGAQTDRSCWRLPPPQHQPDPNDRGGLLNTRPLGAVYPPSPPRTGVAEMLTAKGETGILPQLAARCISQHPATEESAFSALIYEKVWACVNDSFASWWSLRSFTSEQLQTIMNSVWL